MLCLDPAGFGARNVERNPFMGNLCIVGLQWGDEGKGKIVDALAGDFDLVVRYQGGSNAGHSVVVNGQKFVLHLLPSGILRPGKLCVIANGVVVDPPLLLQEMDELMRRGVEISDNLAISDRAHLVLPYHKELEKLQEADPSRNKIGTTGRGIGPCYVDKAARMGIRVGDMLAPVAFERKLRVNIDQKNRLFEFLYHAPAMSGERIVEEYLDYAQRLRPRICDTVALLAEAQAQDKRILFEGAQGALLDLDFGTYPYITSSSASAGGAVTGTGVSPKAIGRILGVMKAYTTRVGEGPFPTELNDDIGRRLRERGGEFGATTGRPRRCGWCDLVGVRYTAAICGVDSIAMTKLDVLTGLETISVATEYRYNEMAVARFPAGAEMLANCRPVYRTFAGWKEDLSRCRKFSDLPPNARAYVAALEEMLGLPVESISVGSGRDDLCQALRASRS
jgi:adenylosuccinate synthase